MAVDIDASITERALTLEKEPADAPDDGPERGVVDGRGGGVSGQRIELPGGSTVLIRQVEPGDAAGLAGGFARLSAESRRLRFLAVKPELSPAELHYFTDVDHHDHEALAGLDPTTGGILGIARYIRRLDHPEAAEIAVAIVDDWQGQGLGTELLTELTDRARQEGIRRFTALVAADNVAVVALLRNISSDVEPTHYEAGTVEYVIALAPAGLGDGLRALLRAFARRQLTLAKPIRDVLAALVADRFAPKGK